MIALLLVLIAACVAIVVANVVLIRTVNRNRRTLERSIQALEEATRRSGEIVVSVNGQALRQAVRRPRGGAL